MTINEYQKIAMTTLNKDMNEKDVLINGVMGLCGESGEACDIVKKHVFQGHALDRSHLIEELGDVAWYMAELATVLNVNLEDVLEGNINKLKARYPEGFDSERSVNRAGSKEDSLLLADEAESDLSDDNTDEYFDNLDEEFRRQIMGV